MLHAGIIEWGREGGEKGEEEGERVKGGRGEKEGERRVEYREIFFYGEREQREIGHRER